VKKEVKSEYATPTPGNEGLDKNMNAHICRRKKEKKIGGGVNS